MARAPLLTVTQSLSLTHPECVILSRQPATVTPALPTGILTKIHGDLPVWPPQVSCLSVDIEPTTSRLTLLEPSRAPLALAGVMNMWGMYANPAPLRNLSTTCIDMNVQACFGIQRRERLSRLC